MWLQNVEMEKVNLFLGREQKLINWIEDFGGKRKKEILYNRNLRS